MGPPKTAQVELNCIRNCRSYSLPRYHVEKILVALWQFSHNISSTVAYSGLSPTNGWLLRFLPCDHDPAPGEPGFLSASQCPLWVISRHLQRKKACPLCPRKRTFVGASNTHVRYVPRVDIAQRHSMRKGPPFGSPSNALIFFLLVPSWLVSSGWCLLIAPVLTSITPICASNAHG